MRALTLCGFLIVAATALVVLPEPSRGQPGGKGKGKQGGGPGGFSFGDPKARFDQMANGRGFFLISESKARDSMQKFAEQKNVTDGKITYPLYLEYTETLKSRMFGPQNSGGGMFKTPTPSGGAGDFAIPPVTVLAPAAPQQSMETLNQYSDEDFRKRDLNDDGKLNGDEMPSPLKESLEKYDVDMDGLIDILEYRKFFINRLKSMGLDDKMGKGKKGGADAKDPEDDWDRRPTVLRAGKLHKDLPSWFKELDIDGDGQVALYEWRQAKKPLDEFRTWDTNDDGFITQEEALKLKLALTQKKGPDGAIASADGSSMRGPGMGGKGNKGGGGNPFGGGGNPFGGGGFGGKGKKADRQQQP